MDATGTWIIPNKSLTVYSAYQQLVPAWLISNLNGASGSQPETIGSQVISPPTVPLLNGSNSSTFDPRISSFADRSVANDHWELVITEVAGETENTAFLDDLQQMLAQPIPDDPSTDFLTDIQLWIGWAYTG
jgi:hypothetical protein